jgi:hypothetical protein
MSKITCLSQIYKLTPLVIGLKQISLYKVIYRLKASFLYVVYEIKMLVGQSNLFLTYTALIKLLMFSDLLNQPT